MLLSTSGIARADARSECQSEWVKFKSFFDKNGPKIAKGICQLLNKDDAAKAKKCVDDYEKNKAKVEQVINKYNQGVGDSPSKVGPRGLGEGQWKTGTLLAQRTFAGAPVMSDTYRLDLVRTGGKANKALQGKVCFLDKDGRSAAPTASFTIDRKRSSFSKTFSNVAGLIPVILLSKPWGFNGHQYKIKGASGGEPKVVQQARKRASGANAGNGKCSNPCPKGGKYDGANCYIGSPPAGTRAFLWANNYYYTPQPWNRCTAPGSHFDGANCFVKKVPAGTKPFIYANKWYYKSCP
jgi:hypothetical protein